MTNTGILINDQDKHAADADSNDDHTDAAADADADSNADSNADHTDAEQAGGASPGEMRPILINDHADDQYTDADSDHTEQVF